MKILVVVVGLIGLTVLACSGGASSSGGDIAKGKEVFTGAGGCTQCHTVQGTSSGSLGPELTHIGTVAKTRQPGVDDEVYIRESISNPPAYLVPGFGDGVMPKDYGSRLNQQQLTDLVAYLASLN